jgi:hypothetical protein
MQPDKKKLKRNYQQDRRPMGIFQVRNMVSERVFVAAGVDLQGIINRHRFDLEMGSHHNKELQTDWNDLGSASFAFEILDQMQPRDDPDYDSRKDLASLKELWLEKLRPYGARGYNERELKRDEKLRLIAARRLQ